MNRLTFLHSLLVLLFCISMGNLRAQTTIPQCGTPDSTLAHYLLKHAQKTDISKTRIAAGERLEYRLALDINYATYLLYNGDKEWIKRVAYKFIDDASKIFEREINVKLTVTTILIWDQPEPYPLTNDGDYFSNVYNYWTQNRTDKYDALVGMSVRYGWFYGGYRMCTSNFPEPNNPLLAVDLLGHELGHTLGSPHTHNCSWPGGPIDYCEALEGCSGNNNYREYVTGSLMSYCRSILSFHPLCRNLMRDYAEGNVNSSFKLNALNKKPGISNSLQLLGSNAQAAANTPTFEWSAPEYVDNFRFQISKNPGFTDIEEDTLIRQSYFRSAGLGQGNYYARFTASNSSGAADWSSTVPFSVPGFSANSSAPILQQTFLHNDATITGSFKKYAGTDSYQVEIVSDYNPSQQFLHQIAMSEASIQSFDLPLLMDKMGQFKVRIRVGKDQQWSQWSESKVLTAPWNSELWQLTNLSKVADSPVLATALYRPAQSSIGLTQSIEIATDRLFKEIVFKDSSLSYQINDWHNNKAVFNPQLAENKTYHIRTRVNYEDGLYSKWSLYSLTTGYKDRRFEFFGTVASNLRSTNMTFADFQSGKLYTKGSELYVHSLVGGYYTTTDLKNWQSFTTSSTQGRIPNQSNLFGLTDDGKTYIYDANRALLKNSKAGATEYYYNFDYVYIPNLTRAWELKNDGVMFRTDNLGVAHVKAGEWKYYNVNTFGTLRSTALAADAEGKVWNVMENGNVWSYQNNAWSWQSYFFQPYAVKGIAFDNKNTCYLYGDFGVATLNESRNWEIIPALSGTPARKIVFDKKGQMWIASYAHNGSTYINYSLIKFKDQKASVYSDGLNFLKEPFDIELFNDKLVILTGGGEIQTFDETLIQAFEPAANYCTGDELSLALTTNSTFAADNKISIQLTHSTSQQTSNISNLPLEGNVIKAKIPTEINPGAYRMVLATTNPEIQSSVQNLVNISAPAAATLKQEQASAYATQLTATAGENLTYKWLLNDNEISSGTTPTIKVYTAGAYTVEITTKNGCKSVSDAVSVQIDQPSEFTLLQNAPNPVTTTSELVFYLPQAKDITLELYNNRGQYLQTLKSGFLQKGWHNQTLDASALSSGTYLCNLKMGTQKKTIKVIKL
jgi:hypothetical protein